MLTGKGRSRVQIPNEVAAPQLFSWHSDRPALILIQPSAFSKGYIVEQTNSYIVEQTNSFLTEARIHL